MGRKKKYFTEEERKEAKRETALKYYYINKEKISEYKKGYDKQRYQNNREKKLERNKQYRQTPMGRANYLLQAYKQNDKKAGRGECTLTSKWIVKNIFPKPCHWCGETGWEIMGCDRIHNELPHTPDNVNPCCEACNRKRGVMTYDEFEKALRAEETTL